LDVAAIARALDHHATHVAVRAERAMLRRLGGGCQVPIAALATAGEDGLSLSGLIAATDGTAVVKGAARGTVAEPETLGIALAEDLLERGGRVILERLLGGQGRG
jgi:hydroxymethylbilane synthase